MSEKEVTNGSGATSAKEAGSLSESGVTPEMALLLKEQAQRVMQKIPLLGAVSWLLMQQNATRHTLLSELEWRVMPALVLNQSKIYMRNGGPLAFVSWALLSDAVAQRFSAAPHHLMPADWKSGQQIWVVDLCAPFGGAQEVMKDLQKNVFPGQEIRQLRMDADERIEKVIWSAAG